MVSAVTVGCGPSAQEREEAVAAFSTVQQVLQHPRCVNCHIPGDAPLQFDEGTPHQMGVVRGDAGIGVPGLQCGTCHGEANAPASYGPHAPPGAPGWRLPPPEAKMVFLDATPGQICETLKDKSKNGNKDFEALLHHFRDDELVGWGWSPGGDRAPVPIPREELVAKFQVWADAGGPCPD